MWDVLSCAVLSPVLSRWAVLSQALQRWAVLSQVELCQVESGCVELSLAVLS